LTFSSLRAGVAATLAPTSAGAAIAGIAATEIIVAINIARIVLPPVE
jgi:hypothetical protein